MKKQSEISGQITVFAALAFMLVISLVISCIKSARDSSYDTIIKQACELAAESVFSGYCNDMLDEFDVLLLRKSDMLDAQLSAYINDNLSAYSTEIVMDNAAFDEVCYVTDHGGAGIRQEVLGYMNYGIYSEVIQSFLESEQQVKKSKKVKEITDDIAACEEKIYEMDRDVLQLIELVEGIDTNDAGIVIMQKKPHFIGDYYVKSVVHGPVTMGSVNVDERKVFDVLSGTNSFYVDVDALLADMASNADDLYHVGDEVSDESGGNSYKAIYERNYKKLSDLISGAKECIDQALKVIQHFEGSRKSASATLDACETQLENGREIIGEELYNGLHEDLEEIKTKGTSYNRIICNVALIKDALLQNSQVIDAVKQDIQAMDVELKQNNCMQTREHILNCSKILASYTNTNLKFDYSGVDFSAESTGLSVIKKIYSVVTDGIMGLVLNTDEVSDKSVEIEDLATGLSGEYDTDNSFVQETVDTALYDEYVLSRFNAYTDYLEEGEGKQEQDSEALLDYMVEYILCGHESDQENLKQVMLEISVIREGMNMAYLLTDSEKKNEAYGLAVSLLGFTGNAGAIKAGQYLIMSVWAYGEAIMDLKSLYRGERVEFVKRKDNWKLSLIHLLTMQFPDVEENQKKAESGFVYRDYLRMLLLTESSVKKNFRTMGAMELRMIECGHEDFRMRDYMISADATAVFRCKGREGFYSQTLHYGYL